MAYPFRCSQISALDQSIINDLASSRQEVEALKNHVSQLVAQCESQAKQIAAAVHEQVAATLAAQPTAPPAQAQQENTITQDQFTMFVQLQDTKFDSMMALFRDMMELKMNNHHPQEPGHHTAASNKRGPPTDLDDMSQADESMELDSETPGSRKRNDHRQTPVKNQVQLFPLFRQDVATSGVSRNLFPGEELQKAKPTSVPLPESPRQEERNSTSLTAAEDVSQSNSSGTESEPTNTADHHAGP